MDSAKAAHACAMDAAERATVAEEQPPQPPHDLDAATAELEAELRKVTEQVHATEAPPIVPTTEEQK